jgi:hypothetical protein
MACHLTPGPWDTLGILSPPRHPLGEHGTNAHMVCVLAFTGTRSDTKKTEGGRKIKSGSKNSLLFHPSRPPSPSDPQVHSSPLVPTATLQSEKNKFRGAGFGGQEGRG